MVTSDRLKLMTDVIAHRGPDGEGQWVSPSGEVGLGHRRLSIIDLSHEADQPMHYMDRYSIVFNGEVYNYIELKEDLLKEGYSFKTASDTEVLMALYDRYKEKCLPMLDGMFSFVVYDAKENIAFCARDRFGEKPFFYSHKPGEYFYFGSEMKCLWAGGIAREVNNRMLFNYMAYGFLDNPYDNSETFYNQCTRMPHSHYAIISLHDMQMKMHRYYDIDWRATNTDISYEQAAERFRELFYTSVKRRLRSDVPVGSSLSGGLDSSLVVTVIDELKKGTAQKQNTFSAVFPGYKKDERRYMDMVIAKTNVEPHFVTPDDEGMVKELEKLAWHQEEPITSASIYAQYCVMRLAKENNVTVLLDGQGADEILAGYHPYYNHYFLELKRQDRQKYKTEMAAYNKLHEGSQINDSVVSGWKNLVKSALPGMSSSLLKMYQRYQQYKTPLFSDDFYASYFKESFTREFNFETLNHSLYYSTMQRGLQELMRYADRNSMANSREVRLPFLNHDLVDFLFTLPSEYKIREGWTKWIMRKTFSSQLPEGICWRKDKIGYEPPQKSWMENPVIKQRIEANRELLIGKGVLSPKIVERAIVAEDANVNKGNNWQIWVAGNLY